MLILMRAQATPAEVDAVCAAVEERGFRPVRLPGEDRTAIGVLGSNPISLRDSIVNLPGVADAVPVSKPFKLVGREFHPETTVVDVGDVHIGGDAFVVMAGPCSVESEEQLMEAAAAVAESGGHMLRGGAFKPRTSPYSFRGLGEEGLKLLARARDRFGLGVVTEVMNIEDVGLVGEYADMLQVGARNMQNYGLLEAAGRSHRPILLKRGMSSTIEEWLLAAEYILSQGNPNVVLCERGIRTFETYTRFTTDLSAVPLVRELSHLPVIVDPSQGTGKWSLVGPMGAAAMACGAAGVIVEVHPHPDHALSDGAQSLTPKNFASMMQQLRAIAAPLDRTL
ncbi:MAG: 3-deoxy-7-phosphoheptulonate synthase [Chloroflexota bacterium]|jgi:3-deoxy-7-phosphoheptulonate synthase|nr:3-deoxy-7-phosphoheptulonate synthase [Chloroflexota bacterium]